MPNLMTFNVSPFFTPFFMLRVVATGRPEIGHGHPPVCKVCNYL